MTTGIDHLVFTVADIARTCALYRRCLGMTVETFGEGRTALRFGAQKINLHQQGRELSPRALAPALGSQDLCLLASVPLDEVARHLEACSVAIELGPVRRTGPLTSLYFRDPDGNLIEIARPD